jgi:hypothetical protein
MNEKQLIRRIVDEYARVGSVQDGEIKVIRVQDRKTTYVEPNGAGGQSIVMDEYKVDGKIYWAGFSTRSQTVYVSLAASPS